MLITATRNNVHNNYYCYSSYIAVSVYMLESIAVIDRSLCCVVLLLVKANALKRVVYRLAKLVVHLVVQSVAA